MKNTWFYIQYVFLFLFCVFCVNRSKLFCSLFLFLYLGELDAAELARTLCAEDLPGRTGLERSHQTTADLLGDIVASGSAELLDLLTEELDSVDLGTGLGRSLVPDNREVVLDVVEAGKLGYIAELAGYNLDRVRGGSHDAVSTVVGIGDSVASLVVLRSMDHGDDKEHIVVASLLDDVLVGVGLESVAKTPLAPDIVTHVLIVAVRTGLAPLIVVLAMPDHSVAISAIVVIDLDERDREVLPDALTESEVRDRPVLEHLVLVIVLMVLRELREVVGARLRVHDIFGPANIAPAELARVDVLAELCEGHLEDLLGGEGTDHKIKGRGHF